MARAIKERQTAMVEGYYYDEMQQILLRLQRMNLHHPRHRRRCQRAPRQRQSWRWEGEPLVGAAVCPLCGWKGKGQLWFRERRKKQGVGLGY